MSSNEIMTVTVNPTIDTCLTVEQIVPERKLRCEVVARHPGGGGINVARVVDDLGGHAVSVHTRGGPIGDVLDRELQLAEDARIGVPIGGATRENTIVRETGSGQQFRFGVPGPELEEEEWRAVLEAVEDRRPAPAYLVASGSLPPGVPEDFYARLGACVRDGGTRFVVDASGAELAAAVEHGAPFLIKPNQREVHELTGTDPSDGEEPENLAKRLVEDGKCEVVVVSLGRAGAMAVSSDGVEEIRAPKVEAVSKIGAGDSMVGGIVTALARGEALADAVAFGVAAGSAATMTPGTALCRADDVERLHRKMRRGRSMR
jgi:6-phosphofructokinase 2